MANRLQNKVAIIVGAGQTPGDTIGNGRATAILFAREGAKCLCVDRRLDSAQDTCAMIEKEGGQAVAFDADVTRAGDCKRMAQECVQRFGRIDILHNNVGIGAGDSGVTHLEEAAWDRIFSVNLKSVFLACKEVIPIMRQQGGGSIVNISSIAALCSMNGMLAYKVSKAGVNSITHQMAEANARYGIRVNAIMPGLMDTPMAIEGIVQARGIPKDKVRSARDAQVPLGAKMGTGWDVAYAALFLASDEARFITGVLLPVDGGQSGRVG
ncbi:MAG TPA: SDR family NAD(P)-dependent oxidoreductase [Candidatus Binataceae bacterium]|jgi:NAD(P)-dependent dehydrogenase (short-subunit alcohol dehydrogenase family)|nr:SDR family NAD(P)-dependent oxidoreductase [Candidatus Binataceae bacterium]